MRTFSPLSILTESPARENVLASTNRTCSTKQKYKALEYHYPCVKEYALVKTKLNKSINENFHYREKVRISGLMSRSAN